MFGRGIAAIAAACVAVLCLEGPGGSAAQAQVATPEMFGALPYVSDVQISPNGKTIAMLQSEGGLVGIVFYDLEGGAKPDGVGVGKFIARDMIWVDDQRLLLLISDAFDVGLTTGVTKLEQWRWVVVTRGQQKSTTLLGNEPGLYISEAGRIISLLPDDPDHVLLARFTTGSVTARYAGYSLIKVNLDNGKGEVVQRPVEMQSGQWVVDGTGRAVIRVEWNSEEEERRLYTRGPTEKDFTLAFAVDEKRDAEAEFTVQGLDPAGRLIGSTRTNRNTRAFVEIDAAAKTYNTLVYGQQEFDADIAFYDARSAAVIGVAHVDDFTRPTYFKAADQQLINGLKSALPGGAPRIDSRSADEQRLVIRSQHADKPDQFYLFDRSARNLSFLASSYAKIPQQFIGRREKYDYVASDGLKIPGYITVPPGAAKSGLPLIVLPHGGPEARDNQAFDWWAGFYAARGYLVYQPNFRGSDGYGKIFRDAGHGEWGRKMQDDISEGVRKLIADGAADPERVCIVGASYGGYAALAGATLTPDLYACTVAVAPVSDLIGMLSRESREGAEDFWTKRIGDRFKDESKLREVNPVDQVANVAAPVMLIHGRDDTIVPINQSHRMRDALARAKKPHVFLELKGEDHWLSQAPTRTEMLRASIEFIDKHIGAGGGAAASAGN